MTALFAALLLAAGADETPDERAGLHFQATVATQAHPAFDAAYSGKNSMSPDAESATSVVTDLFAGVKLWRGAELYFQPELSGGTGLSLTVGVAAFPSGEVYRVGSPRPAVLPARFFLRQSFGLGGGSIHLESGPNQLAGSRDRDALTFTVGKVAIPDFVDDVPCSNDPHTHFMSWGLFASAAYDYPADTRGYTWGAEGDLSVGWWSLRGGIFLEPQYANLLPLEWDVSKARGLVAEFEGRFKLAGRPGAARVLAFLNDARMGSYEQALQMPVPDVAATRAFGRTKYGFAGSANLDLGAGLQGFARGSWNDGANETWAFTEIDRSAAVGAVQSGSRWGRDDDEAGAALLVSGLSNLHRRYLAAGGYGFLIGDGALHYGPEMLAELYYRAALTHEVSLGAHWQPVINPAYNRDRGPIQVFTARLHVAFLIMRAALLITLLSLACGTHADQVCEDVGLCRGQTDDQVTACQTEAKELVTEARASGCASQVESYFACADSHYSCSGDVPGFAGCESQRAALDGCLAAARAGNSCGVLDARLAACPGGGPPPDPVPAPCGATELCSSRCFLDDVADVCRPQSIELVDFSHCVQQCP